jgi:hypothetical protein
MAFSAAVAHGLHKQCAASSAGIFAFGYTVHPQILNLWDWIY